MFRNRRNSISKTAPKTILSLPYIDNREKNYRIIKIVFQNAIILQRVHIKLQHC